MRSPTRRIRRHTMRCSMHSRSGSLPRSRCAAMLAVVAHPAPPDVAALRRYAGHQQPAVRGAALNALAAYPDPLAHAAIVAGLHDPTGIVRAQAANAAGKGPRARSVRSAVRVARSRRGAGRQKRSPSSPIQTWRVASATTSARRPIPRSPNASGSCCAAPTSGRTRSASSRARDREDLQPAAVDRAHPLRRCARRRPAARVAQRGAEDDRRAPRAVANEGASSLALVARPCGVRRQGRVLAAAMTDNDRGALAAALAHRQLPQQPSPINRPAEAARVRGSSDGREVDRRVRSRGRRAAVEDDRRRPVADLGRRQLHRRGRRQAAGRARSERGDVKWKATSAASSSAPRPIAMRVSAWRDGASCTSPRSTARAAPRVEDQRDGQARRPGRARRRRLRAVSRRSGCRSSTARPAPARAIRGIDEQISTLR